MLIKKMEVNLLKQKYLESKNKEEVLFLIRNLKNPFDIIEVARWLISIENEKENGLKIMAETYINFDTLDETGYKICEIVSQYIFYEGSEKTLNYLNSLLLLEKDMKKIRADIHKALLQINFKPKSSSGNFDPNECNHAYQVYPIPSQYPAVFRSI